ncbi:bifunctional riboflavin kinase/FAD synthetase [Nocardioides humilatus]|uniref:Riboflavin biosynthesis protein n=1 Tax=Nocardioides humilatus TaxID=2607660 RepID=A0A5B1LJ96_9ACTN|nr:bifunctional riboflavin kinase/FAD synthetase [Nocardioides humilatus]
MQVWRELGDVPEETLTASRSVVTIGNFDGMHLGHQHVVSRTRERAEEIGVETVVAVTFDPHPIAVLRPEHAPPTLTTIDERLRLMGEAGVDAVLVIPFSREIAAWTPQEFIDRILVDSLHAKAVVVGANFRFGNRAAGDVHTLADAGGAQDFTVEAVQLDGGPQVWSSTYVRTCLAAGDVAGAAEALGRPFVTRGVVIEGDKRGRELGFPTANVPVVAGSAAPADGVYAGWLTRLDGASETRLPAAISVGTNPTFDGQRDRRVEAYVLDRTDLALYGVEVEVAFIERIRGMVRFDGIDDLLVAIADDVERTREILGS